MTLNEIKHCELDILSYIDEVCKNNNITYYLAYGTLLGAVRHNGFIPWDDDIDVFMFRDDYNRFISSFLNNELYKLLSLETDNEYYYPFAKVVDKRTRVNEELFKSIENLGVWVDIFPLDYYDPRLIKKRKVDLYSDLHLVSRYKSFQASHSLFRTIIKRIVYYFIKNQSPKKYALWFNELGNKSKIPQNEVCVISGCDLYSEKWKTKWFETSFKHKFEDREFFVPGCYDDILKTTYGDYMMLPPENERVSKHLIEAYFVDKDD